MLADAFRLLAAPHPDALALVSRDGRVLAVNPSAAELLGLPPDTDGSLALAERLGDPTELEPLLARFSRSASFLPGSLTLDVQGGALRCRCEGAAIALGEADASGRPVLLRFRTQHAATERFRLLNQKIDELSGEIHDRRRAQTQLEEQAFHLEELTAELEHTIEELQQQRAEAEEARRDAERASRAKSEFLAVVSHELRTPLNAIIGYAELLRSDPERPLDEPQRRQLERIVRSAAHLSGLIDQILDLSRLDAGVEEVHFEDLDLVRLAAETCELMEPAAREAGLELRIERPEEPLHVRSEARKVRQILLNLLSNAVKFTERGAIRVVIAAAAEDVRVEVHDTGIGIAEADRERIFGAFTQVDASLTRRAGGTGLGLAVSRQLARLLGGDVVARSTPGAGSVFTLHLPSSA